MLRNKFSIDHQVFAAKGWKTEPRPAIQECIDAIKPAELTRLAKQLETFLLQEDEIDYVLKAKTYVKALLTKT